MLDWLTALNGSELYGELLAALQKEETGCSPGPCPRIYKPVCGADGSTYANACLACGVEITCKGSCPCQSPGLIQEDPGNCKPGRCTDDYMPVCSTRNNTYTNACGADLCGATVECQGECPCLGRRRQRKLQEMVELPTHSKCEQKPCPLDYRPQCGTDGVTYANSCRAEACRADIACEGTCPCPGYPGSSPDQQAAGGICPMIFAPACDVTGTTHGNLCIAKAAGAELACQGECPCPDLLAEVQRKQGMLMAPTDELLLHLLAAANTTIEGTALDVQALRGLLAGMTVLSDTLNIEKNGSVGMSEAGHRLVYLSEGTTGEPSIVDLDGDEEFHIGSALSYCGVTIVQLDWVQETELGYAEPAASSSPEPAPSPYFLP